MRCLSPSWSSSFRSWTPGSRGAEVHRRLGARAVVETLQGPGVAAFTPGNPDALARALAGAWQDKSPDRLRSR